MWAIKGDISQCFDSFNHKRLVSLVKKKYVSKQVFIDLIYKALKCKIISINSSFINKIGTPKFLRLRIGIGHPGSKDEVTKWVLNKFTANEKKHLVKSYSKFIDVFELIASKKIQEVQKLLHTK